MYVKWKVLPWLAECWCPSLPNSYWMKVPNLGLSPMLDIGMGNLLQIIFSAQKLQKMRSHWEWGNLNYSFPPLYSEEKCPIWMTLWFQVKTLWASLWWRQNIRLRSEATKDTSKDTQKQEADHHDGRPWEELAKVNEGSVIQDQDKNVRAYLPEMRSELHLWILDLKA